MLCVVNCSTFAASDWGQTCSTVKAVHAWQGGSDTYGLRIEMTDAYAGCDAFYVPNSGGNKQFVYGTALVAFTAGLPACIQIALVSDTINGNLCKINKIHLTK